MSVKRTQPDPFNISRLGHIEPWVCLPIPISSFVMPTVSQHWLWKQKWKEVWCQRWVAIDTCQQELLAQAVMATWDWRWSPEASPRVSLCLVLTCAWEVSMASCPVGWGWRVNTPSAHAVFWRTFRVVSLCNWLLWMWFLEATRKIFRDELFVFEIIV